MIHQILGEHAQALVFPMSKLHLIDNGQMQKESSQLSQHRQTGVGAYLPHKVRQRKYLC